MSDFDKEAEREKLEEKYERDREKREATEQMSELLLQGATMTNAHCSDCGDPIFRYDGQEFCPTCEKAVDRDTGGDEATDDERGGIEVTEPDETRVQFGGSPDGEATAPAQSQVEGGTDREKPAQSQNASPAERQSGDDEQPRRQPAGEPSVRQSSGPQTQNRDRGTPAEPRRSQETRAAGGAGLAEARESLVRTIVRFSDRAEATDDPRRAQDNLAAVREAAEALSALDS